MTLFEDFVNTELPRRSSLLDFAITAYDGDPNDGGAPAIIQNAPSGTWYHRLTWDAFYRKNEAGTYVDSGHNVSGEVTGTTLTFQPYSRLSNESFYITVEADLEVIGWWSNGNPGVLKLFGTADTENAGEEGWVAPTAASGWVRLRLLHTTIAEANAGGLELEGVQVIGAGPTSFGPYSFDTYDGADADALMYTTPLGVSALPNASGAGRRWCWDENDTPSSNVGPTSGAGGSPDGYLYTESSSPAGYSDEFELELGHPGFPGTPWTFDTTSGDLLVDFKTNQRGDDNNAVCVVQTNEGGAGWVTRFTCGGAGDPNKVAGGGVDVWVARVVDLTGLISHVSTRVRILVTLGATGTTYDNDYGIDDVFIRLV